MRKIIYGLLWTVCGMSVAPVQAQQTFRVMEYNVENLFDCRHDSLKQDTEFLPGSVRNWTFNRFQDKLKRIGKVILAAGKEQVPDLVGLCEVENEFCVKSLTHYSPLREAGYRYVMTESPDERGIDVALLYQPASFRMLASQKIRIPSDSLGMRSTRDILYVSGRVASGDTLDVFVCHLPSRVGGAKKTDPYRLWVARRIRQAVDSVMGKRVHPRLIIMGDFNDYPDGKSLQEGLRVSDLSEKPQSRALYNLMENQTGGTYRYKGEWGILDQMVVNGDLLQPDARTRTSKEKASIVRFPFLLEEDNVYGGDKPFRTYKGMKYQGGYSDHLPVLLELTVEE